MFGDIFAFFQPIWDKLLAFLNTMPAALSQGLIWGVMAIGLYITYRLLELSDLTVDGSFCTGGAVCVMMLLAGFHPVVAMMGAMLAGMLTGLVTGFLHTTLKIPAILAGILTQLGLWSINLTIMGQANQGVNARSQNLLISMLYIGQVEKGTKPFYMHPIFVVAAVTVIMIFILYWFFGTELGSSIRATGANSNMARAQGINTNAKKMIGLMLSNGLVALAGAMLSQYQGFADINMGRGAIVIGLASVIIGEVVFGRLFKNFGLKLMCVSLGAVIYYVIIQGVITLAEIDTDYMKLISAAIVAVFLAIPNLRGQVFGGRFKKKKEAGHA